MDKTLWQQIAALWVSIRSVKEIEDTENTIKNLFNESISKRHQEKSFLDDLMDGIEDEEDDIGY